MAMTQASTVSDCRVIDKPISYGNPVKPVKKMAYSIALFVGLLLPLLIVTLIMYLNDKVNDKTDIEKSTKAPILGFISLAEGNTNVVVGENTRTAISEQFRALRTNLNFIGIGKRHKFILVTSSMSGEGKTFVATNIASTMALSGKKTIVLEFDLRKPKMSKGLGFDNSIGLSNYLVGKVDLDSIIKNTNISPNLFLISSGAIPPNPSELILTDRMKELMDLLDERFDFVIIDSPPVGLVSDALVLNQYADSSLYIVRQNITTKKHLEIVDELYKENKMNNLAVLLNGVVKVIGKYGYEYGYYEEGYAKNSAWVKIKGLFYKK
jgi:tyrosine-protein kinase Etk/Wzc